MQDSPTWYQVGLSLIMAYLSRYRDNDAFFSASLSRYRGKDATAVKANTTKQVLTPRIKDTNVTYTTLKSCRKEGVFRMSDD